MQLPDLVHVATAVLEGAHRVHRAHDTQMLQIMARENMEAPIVEGPILGGAPRSAIIPAMADHTAHHRGALTVYARLCGKTPSMPYGDAPSE